MTRADAQLLYDYFVQRYGLPLEGATTPALVNTDANHQRERHSKHDPDHRVRRQKNPQHGQGND